MEKVSSSNGIEKYPSLRFEGYTKPWITRSLGDMGTFLKGAPLSKADISDDGTPFVLYGELYTTYSEVTHSIKRKTDKKVERQFYSQIGDVIIPTSGETPEDIATASCIMLPNVILAGDLLIYRTQQIDGRFVSYVIKNKVNKQISRVAQGKSVVHVRADELSKINITFPTSEEQKKILVFFELLDNRITTQQNLIEILKKYKRGLNLKLLSSISAINNTQLGKICAIVGGGTPDTLVSEYWDGDVNWFTPSEIGKSKFVKTSARHISTIGVSKSSAKMLPINTVLLTTRATLGEMSILQTEATTNQGFQSLIALGTVLPEYVYYLQVLIKPWCEKYASGNTFREISKSSLAKCVVPVPDISMQKEIVEVLSGIDEHIFCEERTLEQLQLTKRSLLQKLFT